MNNKALWKYDNELGIAYFCPKCKTFICKSYCYKCKVKIDIDNAEKYDGRVKRS